MNAPTHLKHKPIVTSIDYDQIDGQFANNSDAKALSIGIAQWENNSNDISAKVFRFNDDTQRWSPQSEELPLHRALDLSILAIGAIMVSNGNPVSVTDLNELVVDNGHIDRIREYYIANRTFLRRRIMELRRTIDTYMQSGI
jgi:hypothetical protein